MSEVDSGFVSVPSLEGRRAQAFPILDAAEAARMERFGVPRRFADGERLFETGKTSGGMHLVRSGEVCITGRDAHGQMLPVTRHGPGSFTGELGQLTGRRSFVDGTAIGAVETLFLDSEKLHALLIAEAGLGEKIMRALILRRVGLLEVKAGGPVIVGAAWLPGVARLENFLTRNGIPHDHLDPEGDADARAFIERYTPRAEEMPIVLCPDGSVLRNPTEKALAKCIGMLDAEGSDHTFDVAIVGAGPAGLAAAVYAASEGLSVIVLESRSFGGQAGASARIENYLGFPTGITGQKLMARAYTQAQKFGTTLRIPVEVVKLECADTPEGILFTVHTDGGRQIRSHTVVVASGARYRRPDLPRLKELEGNGVWYWASPMEARMAAGQEVVLVGGGNSAGQAAVYLSGHAQKVWMLVRAKGLAESMSKYLIDRIEATPNIELRTRTEVVEVEAGAAGCEHVTFRDRDSGKDERRPARHVFLFLGAEPSADWVRDCGVEVDARGFIRTGPDVEAPREGPREALETSVPGVFAIGDVRSGSVKRVGAAIGEGAAVVQQIHAHIARLEPA